MKLSLSFLFIAAEPTLLFKPGKRTHKNKTNLARNASIKASSILSNLSISELLQQEGNAHFVCALNTERSYLSIAPLHCNNKDYSLTYTGSKSFKKEEAEEKKRIYPDAVWVF